MLIKVKWVGAPLGIWGLDVATSQKIMDGEGSIPLFIWCKQAMIYLFWVQNSTVDCNSLKFWLCFKVDTCNKLISYEMTTFVQGETSRNSSTERGEGEEALRRGSSLRYSCGGAHRGPLGGPMRRASSREKAEQSLHQGWGEIGSSTLDGSKGKIQVKLSPERLNLTLIRIQDN